MDTHVYQPFMEYRAWHLHDPTSPLHRDEAFSNEVAIVVSEIVSTSRARRNFESSLAGREATQQDVGPLLCYPPPQSIVSLPATLLASSYDRNHVQRIPSRGRCVLSVPNL